MNLKLFWFYFYNFYYGRWLYIYNVNFFVNIFIQKNFFFIKKYFIFNRYLEKFFYSICTKILIFNLIPGVFKFKNLKKKTLRKEYNIPYPANLPTLPPKLQAYVDENKIGLDNIRDLVKF